MPGAICREIFEIYSGRYVRFNGAACDDTEICSPWYLGPFPPTIIVTKKWVTVIIICL